MKSFGRWRCIYTCHTDARFKRFVRDLCADCTSRTTTHNRSKLRKGPVTQAQMQGLRMDREQTQTFAQVLSDCRF